MMLNGKRLILAYRLFDDSTTSTAVALALDCAMSANGLAYYNWNETKDTSSSIYDKPDKQSLVQLLTTIYDTLYDVDKRHVMVTPSSSPVVSPVEPMPVQTAPPPAETPPAEGPVPEPIVQPATQ